MSEHYNLLDEAWIPVLYANGRFQRVGIRQALTEAGRIRQIAASNSMDNVALLRFLLAALVWCGRGLRELPSCPSGGPASLKERWLHGGWMNRGSVQAALGQDRTVQAMACAHLPPVGCRSNR